MLPILTLSLLLIGALVTIWRLVARRTSLRKEHDLLLEEHARTIERYKPITDIEAETRSRQVALHAAEAEHQAAIEIRQAEADTRLASIQERIVADASRIDELAATIAGLEEEFRMLDEQATLGSFGFYAPHYAFATLDEYQSRLEEIRDGMKEMIKEGTAAICTTEWTVGGSKAEGKKQTRNILKLIIRAFNGESDAAIAKARYNNMEVMEARIRKAFEVINRMVEVQDARITPEYLDARLQELYLVHEYHEKMQEEKEEQRRIREQMREEEQAQREMERARQEAEKEESRYEEQLRKAREAAEAAVGGAHAEMRQKIEELQRKLAEAQANKERAIAQAQLTRSGHVYIISNIGSFGENVFKIGMTRRLDPLDRVRELGDASVPFDFDVHAIIYSDDAPALENTLHKEFHYRRVNRVNERREFFRVSVDEIVHAVRRHHGAEVEIIRDPEAEQYRKSLALMEEEGVVSQ